ITLDGYRPQPSQVFIPRANQTLEAPVTAMRSPGDWTPAFRPFGELDPDRFARFIRVAKASDAVSFITQAPPLGSLVTAYDNLAGDQGQFAKMALLNLYAVLSDEDDPVSGTRWFELVRKIVRIRSRAVRRRSRSAGVLLRPHDPGESQPIRLQTRAEPRAPSPQLPR